MRATLVADVRQRFTPDTRAKVEWLVRLLLEIQEERARIEATYRARARALDVSLARLASAFEIPLRDWLDRELAMPGNRSGRSVRVSEGIVGKRETEAGFKVEDKIRAARWAESNEPDPANPVFGKLVYIASLKALAAHATKTGEVPDGLANKDASESLFVTSDLLDRSGRLVHKGLNLTTLAKGAPPAGALPRDNSQDYDQYEEE